MGGGAGGNAARDADVFVLEPDEEGKELGAGDGGEGGVVGKIESQFVVGVLVVEDGVMGFAGGAFVEQNALDGAGEG